MKAKKIINTIAEKIEEGSKIIAFTLLTGMGLVLGLNIAMRFLFHHPISWSNEISRYAYIYIVLFGTAISYREGTHAKIDFVRNSVSKKMQNVFDIIHYLVMIFISIILIVFGTKHVITMWPVHAPVLTFLSVGIIYLSVPVSAAAILIFTICYMLDLKK